MEMASRRHGRAASRPSSAFSCAILAIFGFSSVATAASRSWAPAPAPGPTVASHSLFSYEEKTPTGPDKWGALNKDWAKCRDGKEQSPIDISKVKADMGPLEHTYKAGTCTMQNGGHGFTLKWKDGNGKLTVKKKDYTLQQVLPCQWHQVEMHMVHEDSKKARAVDPSKTLSSLGPYFKRLAGKDHEDEEMKEHIDPSPWVDKDSGYYRHEVSLTTPPCTEGVLWTIMSKVKHVSKEQIELLEAVTKKAEHNDRPQKINDRVVHYYEGEAKDGSGKSGKTKDGSAKSGKEKKE